jgi:hypothetical protein
MSYRILIAALAAAGFVLATQSFAEPTTFHGTKSNTPRGSGPAEAINLNSSKSNIYRQGSPKGTGGPARATTVKSSKSNTSD